MSKKIEVGVLLATMLGIVHSSLSDGEKDAFRDMMLGDGQPKEVVDMLLPKITKDTK